MTAGSFLRRRARALTEPQPGEPRRLPFGPARGLRVAGDPTLPLDVWFGLYESELSRFIRDHFRPGMACVDVGSYNGYYALLFTRLGASRVRAYDSDPSSAERIRRNLELNPTLAPAIEPSDLIVAGVADPAARKVTLDDDLQGWERVGLLKIDVEGAERDVLNGASRILADEHPQVIVETHSADLEQSCAELLLEHGYRPRVVTLRWLLPENRHLEHNRWLVAAGGDP